jgi:hypothetical protein
MAAKAKPFLVLYEGEARIDNNSLEVGLVEGCALGWEYGCVEGCDVG